MSPDSLCSRTRLMLPWELTSLWSTHSVLTPILNFSKHISSHLKGRGYHFDFSEKKQSSHLSIFRSLYNNKYANLLLCDSCHHSAFFLLPFGSSLLPPTSLSPSHFSFYLLHLILSSKSFKLFCFCFFENVSLMQLRLTLNSCSSCLCCGVLGFKVCVTVLSLPTIFFYFLRLSN